MDEQVTRRAEAIFKFAQTVAIVVTGAWVFFRYLAHDRQTAELQIQQQRIAYEQSKINYRITEKSVELQQQDLDLKNLQRQKARRELVNAEHNKFEPDAAIKIRRLASHSARWADYEVTLNFTLKNKGDAPLDLSALIVDYFVGVPKGKANREVSIVPMGQPTDRWHPKGQVDGALQWSHLGYLASTGTELPPKMMPKILRLIKDLKFINGGPAIGALPAGETAIYEDTYRVRAPKDAQIAFAVSFCFADCAAGDDYFSLVKTVPLSEEKPQARAL